MPAKPQPMAGQSDAADDLIAELAKLMAQDAQGASPAAPQPSGNTASPVRIPGGEAATLDFARAYADMPDTAAGSMRPSVPASPVTAKPAAEPLEPFNFDFDFGAGKRSPVEPVVDRPAAEKVEAPIWSPAVTAGPAPVAKAVDPVDQDSIADLIAAELAMDTRPSPVVQAPAAPQPIAPPTPASPAAAEPPGAATSNANWTPTAVATNLASQQAPQRPALRPVNLQPVARSEQDRFKVPPVFGLGTTPAQSAETIVPVLDQAAPPVHAAPAAQEPAPRPFAPAPAIESPPPAARSDAALGNDPIDEIENLIGRAMRVEFDRPEPVATPPVAERPAPSPALRTLATPTVHTPRALSPADEAVLAAAEATGAQVGWVEAPEVSDDEPAMRRSEQRRSPRSLGMTRAMAGPLVAVTLLLAAGFGLYWVLGLGGRDSGPAPLLSADASPIKETVAAVAPGASAQQSVVFNEMDGVVPGAEEQLVSRDQTDVNEVTQVASTGGDLSEEGLANRKVRTVTVRPDGTIVSGEDSIAGSAILPVDRPNVPVVPGAETASPELLANAAPLAATPAPVAPVPAVTPVVPGSTVPAVDLAGNPVAGKTSVIPLQRPANLPTVAPSAAAPAPTSPINAIIDTAAAAGAPVSAQLPQPTPAPAAPIAGATEVEALGNDAPAYVQLASQRTEAEARQTAQSMVNRFGPLFGGANMEVQRVDLGARGIFYRVRVPASSLQDANTMCNNVKAAGGDCFTM